MFNLEKIKEAIDNLDDSEMVALWNEYCEANNYYDDYIEWNDIDELLYGCKPSEVLDKVDNNNYSQSDKYCVVDGWGEYVSFDYADADNSPFDLDSLAQWIYDNEDACGYLDEDDISDCFDAISFVDNEMDEDDVDVFIEDNGIDVDENVDKCNAVKRLLRAIWKRCRRDCIIA